MWANVCAVVITGEGFHMDVRAEHARVSRGVTAAGAALLAVLAMLVAVASPSPAAATPEPVCASEALSEAQALSMAAVCNRRVEITSARSTLTTVFAEASGKLVMESSVVPQRARQTDGTWAPIDLSLVVGGDGLLRPRVSAADVAFSGGGSAPMATVRKDGKAFSLSWLGVLPAPAISGDSATYPGVLPDVDLVVRATRTGFTHVLVVKTRAAAANPALRTIRFATGGDAELLPMPDGSTRAGAGPTLVAVGQKASMWDSSRPADGESGMTLRPEGVASPASDLAAERSTSESAGIAAKVELMTTAVTPDGDFVVIPDAEMLADADTVFPVFVDPPWDVVRSRWAYAHNSATCTDGVDSYAWLGRSPSGSCPGSLYRSFFEFPMVGGNGVSLLGKYIHSSYIQMKLWHSYSCASTPVTMFQSEHINAVPRATWSSMNLVTFLGAASGHANKATGCSDSPQSDMYMNFSGANLDGLLRHAASNGWNTFDVGFCACDSNRANEADQARWKKFYPADAKMIVEYDSVPGTPNSLQAAGVNCSSGSALGVGTTSPTFSAVYPDADGGQSLTGAYEWIEVPAGGIGGVTDSSPGRLPAPPSVPASANGRGTTASVGPLLSGKRYAFRVRTTDPAPYYQSSGWSAWCEFYADTTVPPAPTIANGVAGSPGSDLTFTFSIPQDSGSAITKFRYGWSSPPTTEVAATGSTTKTATVTLKIPKYGMSVLWVRAINSVGNLGNLGSVEIHAARPSPAVARWGLESYPGTTTTQALADQQPALNGNTPLIPTNVSWADGVHLVGGQTATFNGSTSVAKTTVPVLDTSKSFSLAAWVRLNTTVGHHLIATQQGGAGAGINPFFLYWDANVGGWAFSAHTDSTGNGAVMAAGPATPVGVWTHVAGVYDAIDDKLRIYVNGVLAGESATYVGWNGTGPLWVGSNSDNTSRLNGQIADLQVFDRGLVAGDFVGQLATDPQSDNYTEPGIMKPLQVGDWTFIGGSPCFADTTDPGLCEAPEFGPFARRLALTKGAYFGLGHRDDALLLDSIYDMGDPSDPSYGTATSEYGKTQTNVGTPSVPVWQNGAVIHTNQSLTLSVWARLDHLSSTAQVVFGQGDGQAQPAVMLGYDPAISRWFFKQSNVKSGSPVWQTVSSMAPAELGVWTHVAATFDAAKSQDSYLCQRCTAGRDQ